MKIVQFSDGKYAIRKSWFFIKSLEQFVDLKDPELEWRPAAPYFHCCTSNDIERVKSVYYTLNKKQDYPIKYKVL